jgi:hypothetical protein
MLTGYVGSTKLSGSGEGLQALPFDINDFYGVSLSSSWEGFSTWVSATSIKFDTVEASDSAMIDGLNLGFAALGTTYNLNIIDNPLLYWSAGAGYNNGDLRIDAEYVGYDWDEKGLLAALEGGIYFASLSH